jgi:putative transposase
MRKSKFTDKQIVEILKVIEDGAPVVETLREKGVSKDTYYKCVMTPPNHRLLHRVVC